MEASLEEVAPAPFSEVDATRVATMSLSDSFGETRLLIRDGNQVNVVCHQAPSKVANPESLPLLSKVLQVLSPVIVREEHVHPPNAALRDVMGQSGDDNTCQARHDRILS